MVHWRRHLLSSKESALVILWYAVYALCFSVFQTFVVNENLSLAEFISALLSYLVFGLVAEMFIGRPRLIRVSLWIQWAAMIMATLQCALIVAHYYFDFPEWVQVALVFVPFMVHFLGLATFQVVAIQYGTSHLHGAPSDQITAFIFWYFSTEIVPRMTFQWISYLLSQFITELPKIQLGFCFLCTLVLSLLLCMKSLFVSHLFSRDPERETSHSFTCALEKSNPYSLTFHVLKFACKHKHPIQRSALTYWEDKIPSRIDLGKTKYGGPYTNEQVEDVKTFLQLIKLLLSLSGIFFASLMLDFDIYYSISLPEHPQNVLLKAFYDCATTILLFLFYALLFSQCSGKYRVSMLNRIWFGAIPTTSCSLSILLMESIGSYHDSDNQCNKSLHSIHLSPYLFLIPKLLNNSSYIILTISFFEFLIAQSPQSVKGILIGMYYTTRYGLGGLFTLVDWKVFSSYLFSSHKLSCGLLYYSMTMGVALISLITFTVVAYKYKLRERDEVVNVHIFAEEYYSK